MRKRLYILFTLLVFALNNNTASTIVCNANGSMTYDGEQLSIKVGKMHIRFSLESSEMAAKCYEMGKIQNTDINYTGSIRVHYDRFDVIRFPILHWICDTKYQQWSHKVN